MSKQSLTLIIIGGLLIFALGYIAGHTHGTNATLHLVEEYMRAPRIHLPMQQEQSEPVTRGAF